MTISAALTALLPLILAALSQVLPDIIGGLVRWIFHPPSPMEEVRNSLDQAIAEGDLPTLGKINTLIFEEQGKAGLDGSTLADMKRLLIP